MKRITQIEISNFKAYHQKTVIVIPEGKNLLIYGQNGCGKTSLYCALKFFFDSFITTHHQFPKNLYDLSSEGNINVTFSDNSDKSKTETISVESQFPYISNVSSYIPAAARTKGFVDYADILDLYKSRFSIYFDKLELFPQFKKLMGEVIILLPHKSLTLNEALKELLEFQTQIKVRRGRKYGMLLRMMSNIHDSFETALKRIFQQLNFYLSTYFNRYQLRVEYVLSQFSFSNYSRISSATLISSLTLNVFKNNILIKKYDEVLNEARLSAISVCLYLSIIKSYPQNLDYKILFLDDLFLGLDLSNRIPVLKILDVEFVDYQIFVTTYDRSWYNLSKNRLKETNNWQFLEMYSGKENIRFDEKSYVLNKPIIIKDQDPLSRAKRFLFDQENPDLPVAANYLRKSLEKFIPTYLPSKVFRDLNTLEPVPRYQLSRIVSLAINFYQRFPIKSYELDNVLNSLRSFQHLLSPLIHPLSHYEIDAPIYREELEDVISEIENYINISKEFYLHCHIKYFLEKEGKLQLSIGGKSGWINNYFIRLDEDLYSYKLQGEKTNSFLNSKCYVYRMEGMNKDGTYLTPFNCSKNSTMYQKLSANSLKELVDNICEFLKTKKDDIIIPSNYRDSLKYCNISNVNMEEWIPLPSK